ncbi:sensor histidine kinase [Robiginitalea biformata]|uniref:histidine kinase n=1 Tax=Robiginitalea biformata (strain ATCC BAA-864 / DSM 15991 / KCTC 12146 / HTCC2501) TaxID=313596 RepID=A4CNP4_ROBBH|nr:HAMP domain-containing sensor histidine kinase [Robiginitalea biformata]EAR14511.1 two-component system sensor histidine kinase [Robiginitalea biformata HTCC2501]
MTFRSYAAFLLLRTFLLAASLAVCIYGWLKPHTYLALGGALVSLWALNSLYRSVVRRFREMDDFFEAVKYRDFSRWFSEKHGSLEIRKLHRGFNLVNKTFKDINQEREVQFRYLQKILEMVEVGIIAFNLETGQVLWVNEYLLRLLDIPSFKRISFIAKRLPQAYEELFETYHATTASVELPIRQDSVRVLIADTVFQVGEDSYKLVVLQNIEETLNRNESDAWKKLLSVMTHEIMNSIAPISSLSGTLQDHIQTAMDDPEKPLELEDLSAGIHSIQRRSEGLMKFARTYRSLHKVTQLNRTTIGSAELFENIRILLEPSLKQRQVDLIFSSPQPDLRLDIDTYLIEQVLINLVINAMDACENRPGSSVRVVARKNEQGQGTIRVIDNGKGIPEEIRETVFVPFFSTKATGSGIGLSLCKQIMTLHRGKVRLRSQVDTGTEIRLIFP